MVKIYYKSIKENSLRVMPDFKVGSWVLAENPTDEEISKLSADFLLETDLLTDATDQFESPRLEVDNKNIYIFTRFASLENGAIITTPVLFVLSEDFTLTLSRKPLPFIKKFLSDDVNFNTTQKTNLLIHQLLEVGNTYNHFLHSINRQVRTLSSNLENIGNKELVQFVLYESVLNDFLSDLVPTNSILNNLLSGRILKLYEDDKDLVEDLLLANNQLMELSKSNLKTLVNIREAYSTIMTNNLNRVIKLFTSLTVLLTIPTMIASIYGMNVPLPFADSPHAFGGILLTIIVISFLLFLLFLKRKWL